MTIAVTSQGQDLDSPIDPRFGRCAQFLLVDSNTMDLKVVPNTQVNSASGAGIQAAQLVADAGADVVLTGNCGPKAFRTLQAADIKVVVHATGTVGAAVKQYMAGDLNPTDDANVGGHFGTNMA